MKNSTFFGVLLIVLLGFAVVPFSINPAKAQNAGGTSGVPQVTNTGQWWQINTSAITVLFPFESQKPMFLWYYNDNSSEVYCVKYRGLIEYLPLNGYYTPDCESNAQNMQSLMISRYGAGVSGTHMNQFRGMMASAYQSWSSEFHPSYLPFSACTWHLVGPSQGTDSNGAYVSFNLTLSGPPSGFGFAENNVAFSCWFYENQTTQNPYGLYAYTIGPSEMRMALSVNNWSWNTNHMGGFFHTMHQDYGVTVPSQQGSLALWCDFATVNMQNLEIALNDANTPLTSVPENSTLAPTGLLEDHSTMTDIIAGGHQIHMQNMPESTTSSLSIPAGAAESYRMQFAQGDKTLPGFFNFINNVAIVNKTTHSVYLGDTTASYRTSDNYMELFICYPYFGSNTLEHDPSIGIDTKAQLVPENLPVTIIFLMVTAIAASIPLARKTKKTLSSPSIDISSFSNPHG